ncbi:hypothetical protein HanIR_Chr08g0349161 [Helianthus annuus]|nr:hypothetical protein HanIR_Chr08g0349161 [Helianthus annuus]
MQQNLTELIPSPNNPFSETSCRTILNTQETMFVVFDFFYFLACYSEWYLETMAFVFWCDQWKVLRHFFL